MASDQKPARPMRIALVHDYLVMPGGSDRVFQFICEAFPDADVFALSLNPRTAYPYFAQRKGIRTTWMNRLVQSHRAFTLLFPLATYAMEGLDLRGYDLVISSSATVARYVRAPDGRHVCYCYIPTRAVWQAKEFFGGSLAGRIFQLFLPYFKRRERQAAARVDEFIAISAMTQRYIRESYGRESSILPCPIDLTLFAPRPDRTDSYLVVSRLVHWKQLDHAIEAFTRLGRPLRVVGTGPEDARLRAMAGPNITFLGAVDDATLGREYARARAVIFTPHLEFGLIPLEANASGTPVIAYGKGGIEETMIPANGPMADPARATAVFYFEQTAAALAEAIEIFERTEFDSAALVRHATKWGVPAFQAQFRKAVGV